MNCKQAQGSFSELVDGTLSPARERLVRAHVDSCERCRERWAELDAALGALRASGPTPTGDALRAAVMRSADEAASADAAAERSFERARALQDARFGRRQGRRLAGASLISALGGLAAGFVLFFGSDRGVPASTEARAPELAHVEPIESAGSAATEAVPERAPRVRYVAVPVATWIERTEVVPRVVEVERTVARGPWIALDLAPLERALDRLGERATRSLADTLARVASLAQPGDPAGGPVEPARVAAAPPTARPDRPDRPEPAVRAPRERSSTVPSLAVRQSGDEVRLEARGPIADVVSMLIARLDDDDPRVQRLVEGRLESIRSELAADPVLGPRLRAVVAREEADEGLFEGWFGAEPPPERAPRERWSEWRSLNRAVLIAAGPAPERVARR